MPADPQDYDFGNRIYEPQLFVQERRPGVSQYILAEETYAGFRFDALTVSRQVQDFLTGIKQLSSAINLSHFDETLHRNRKGN
jgi:hypothetical protein